MFIHGSGLLKHCNYHCDGDTMLWCSL